MAFALGLIGAPRPKPAMFPPTMRTVPLGLGCTSSPKSSSGGTPVDAVAFGSKFIVGWNVALFRLVLLLCCPLLPGAATPVELCCIPTSRPLDAP